VSARANRYLASLLAAGAGALALPALAAAGSGGASVASGGGASGGSTSTSSLPVGPGNVMVSATGDGITIQTEASAFLRSGVSLTGTVPAADTGATVEIDQLASAAGSAATWTAMAVVHPQSNGSFAASWRTTRPGPVTIRAVLQGNQASSANASPPTLSVTVYRRSIATLYGPGFWGHRTACGTILRRRTVGVANRTLPCGTEVQVYYDGTVATVPVIDRGPYAHHANWDLTMATARALGIRGTAVIGAAALPTTSTSTSTSPSGARDRPTKRKRQG
jgi:rare lipoprotein A